jgi:chaperonin GroES
VEDDKDRDALTIEQLQASDNIAELLDDEDLAEISSKVLKGLEIDEDSRKEWKERVDSAQEIAKQVTTAKNYPFENASNIKYPLITQAAIDFAARTYPEVIQNDRVVKPKVIGLDHDGTKLTRAENVAKFMSYQLLYCQEDWEVSLDKLLHILPVVGTVFKKTYYDPWKKMPVSEVCLPEKLVVNYNTQNLESCRRISHIITCYANDIVENIRRGLYRDVDIERLRGEENDVYGDEDPPITLIEQHCFLDLDEDGYAEPYIVTVHKASREVLRIYNRFEKVEKNKKGQISNIVPSQYFTDFHFLRSSDGGYYSVGMGTLLFPLNEAINTLLNQLVDSGSLHNMQGGLIAKGLRIKNGEIKVQMGRYQVLDAAPGVALNQSIFPWPTKEPSQTLFNLLALLIDVGKQLISANDVMQGSAQVQNVSPTTMAAQVQQGMKVFNAITKRLYQALYKEMHKIYSLNCKYLKNKEYQEVIDDPGADVKVDFNLESYDIIPVANPMMATDTQRLIKAQAVLMIPPGIDYNMKKYYLEALQLDPAEINRICPQPDPNAPPPAEVQKTLAETQKLQAEAQAAIVNARTQSSLSVVEAHKATLQEEDTKTRAQEAAARIHKMAADAKNNEVKALVQAAKEDMVAKINEFKAAMESQLRAAEIAIQNRKLSIEEKKQDDGDSKQGSNKSE